MQIEAFRAICLFFIYFLNVPLTVIKETAVPERNEFSVYLGSPRSWQINPQHKGRPSLIGRTTMHSVLWSESAYSTEQCVE